MATINLSEFRFRAKGSKALDKISILKMRGQGGPYLRIGGGEHAIMRKSDVRLSEDERDLKVAMRVNLNISGSRNTVTVLPLYMTRSSKKRFDVPATLYVPGEDYRIMTSHVTCRSFMQLLKAGYKMTGEWKKNIDERISYSLEKGDPDKDELLNLNLVDLTELAKALSVQTGGKWSVPTEVELWRAHKILQGKLSGALGLYEWTRTLFKDSEFYGQDADMDFPRNYVLRSASDIFTRPNRESRLNRLSDNVGRLILRV